MADRATGNRKYFGVAGLLLGLSVCCALPVAAEQAIADGDGGRDEVQDDGFARRFAEAALVAEVQIAGIHRDVDNALSEPGMVAILGYVYSAVSQQVWKGEANSLIAFRLRLDACETKLKKGARYLIFAQPDSHGRLQLHSCDAAVPEAEAAPLLARLRQFGKQG